jgi:hypothetical protein
MPGRAAHEQGAAAVIAISPANYLWRQSHTGPRAGEKEAKVSRVNVGGVGIEYDVTGEGPPVVLLHGFPTPAGCGGTRYRHSQRPATRPPSSAH